VEGLIDTGLDRTVLPLGYADLLGHRREAMARGEAQQAQGRLTIWSSTAPTKASLSNRLPEPFDLRPMFVEGISYVLWGRRDFMLAWDVLVSESRRLGPGHDRS
jgi:hypothetical protein